MLKLLRFSLFLAGMASVAVASAQSSSTGRERVEELVGKLNNSKAGEQFQAVSDLADLGPLAKPAVPTLVKTLKSSDDLALQHEILIALGRIGTPAAEAVPALSEFLKNASPVLQYEAIQALRKIGSEAKSALPQLTELMKSDKPFLSVPAAWAVAAISKNADENRQALPVLLAGLASKDSGVVGDAEMGLAAVGKPAISEPGLASARRQRGCGRPCGGCLRIDRTRCRRRRARLDFGSGPSKQNRAVACGPGLGQHLHPAGNRGARVGQETWALGGRGENRRRFGIGRLWKCRQRCGAAIGLGLVRSLFGSPRGRRAGLGSDRPRSQSGGAPIEQSPGRFGGDCDAYRGRGSGIGQRPGGRGVGEAFG